MAGLIPGRAVNKWARQVAHDTGKVAAKKDEDRYENDDRFLVPNA
jgi:hypothetical protein